MSRDAYWALRDRPGCEHARLAAGPNGGLYRHESLARGFSAELPVDSDGLVTDYPETFRRVWPR